MNKSCPISSEQVDANLVRINAFLVAILAIVFIFTQNIIFAILLAVDFFIRIFINPKFSYLLLLAKIIKKVLGIKSIKTDAAPKKFASIVGLIFSVLIVLFKAFSLITIANILTVILTFCALLEALFNYCVGCQVYYILQAISNKSSTKNEA